MSTTLVNQDSFETVPIKKKGRPKKIPMESTLVENCKNVLEKKKRGRKKKEKVEVEEVTQKKKRGRKATLKFYSSTIRKKMPLNTVIYDNDNALLHLEIKAQTNESNNKQITYDVLKNEYGKDNQYVRVLNSDTDTDNDSDDKHKDTQDNENNKNSENNEDDDILCDYIDNALENLDITDLYEQRLESRRVQDNQLISKLDNLHNDNDLLHKLLQDVNKRKHSSCETKIDDEIDNKIDNEHTGYFSILSQYIDTSNWIDNTNVACWWCCHTFDSIPIGCPVNYRKGKFRVKGIYCSFSCLVAYKNDNVKTTETDYLINTLYKRLTEGIQIDAKEYIKDITKYCEEKHFFEKEDEQLKKEYISSLASFLESPLQPAPPRCTLKMFGGKLTIEQFRNATKERKIYKMVEYPMYISRDYIEKVDLHHLKKVNKNVFNKQITLPSNKLDDKKLEEVKSRMNSNVIVAKNNIEKFIKW